MPVKDLIELYDVCESDGSDEASRSRIVSKSDSSSTRTHRKRLRPAVSPLDITPTNNIDVQVPSTTHDSTYVEHTAESSRLLGNHWESNGDRESGGTEMRRILGNNLLHRPIPATTVFARNAPPLDLPDLNNYLACLPPPAFSSFSTGVRKGKEVFGVGMFPPMDQLAATGSSLQDLETNSVIRPPWRNRNSIFGGLVNFALAVTGSSAVATFYSLHGILDTIQIFALLLSTILPLSNTKYIEGQWKELFLGVIPNILALNFGSTVVQSLAFLGFFMGIAALLLYYFWIATNRCEPPNAQEGFPSTASRKSDWGLIIVSFVLSILYLPLSTIATHALVWADDFWVVPNPYINATSDPPVLPPLGPPDEFHDPFDFCYTTTMRRNEVNFAPIVLILSALTFLFMTIWFPLRLRQVVEQSVPRVDPYTELGKSRSNSEMDREYQRLLDRDRQPLTFLYSDFRRGWGTYKALYLFAKLSALIIIAVISPDNCLFRSFSRMTVSIIRQAVLVATMLAFFLLQCFLAPFVDPVNNASEWTSRLNYLLTSLVGVGVAVKSPGQDALNGPILYIIYILTYGLGVYFTLINFSWMRRVVKRIMARIDFSIDVFSPKIDLSPSSPHIKRRIWQETLTTLFLTSLDCKIPSDQPMLFADARDSGYPPYLLNFKGTPGERHVENLKILREGGLKSYSKALAIMSENDTQFHDLLYERIQREIVGPDCFWNDPEILERPRCTSHFGTAWWIPFPPTLVLRYDDGPLVVLRDPRQLHAFVHQNLSREVKRKQQLRLALRALDGQIVQWPYEHTLPVGRHLGICCCKRQYQARSVLKFRSAVLKINRKGRLSWRGFELGSGFGIELVYSKDVKIDRGAVGLSDEWDLSPSLARFVALNQAVIEKRLPILEYVIQDYREFHWRESVAKRNVLSYRFLTTIYNKPQAQEALIEYMLKDERDLRVRQLVLASEAAFGAAFERFTIVTSSEAASWWYIFWDDLWRRNNVTIKGLSLHFQDFDPHYPTSVAYRPLPRPALESFLAQRGLYSVKLKPNGFFHPGLLNKIYFRLNGIVFRDPNHAVIFHLGEGPSEFSLSHIDKSTHARSSSLGTGGGTDHDDSSIRARPAFRWEGILEDPLLRNKNSRENQGWVAKLGVWFGLTPLWRTGRVSRGLSLDVKLKDGRYVLISRHGNDENHS